MKFTAQNGNRLSLYEDGEIFVLRIEDDEGYYKSLYLEPDDVYSIAMMMEAQSRKIIKQRENLDADVH